MKLIAKTLLIATVASLDTQADVKADVKAEAKVDTTVEAKVAVEADAKQRQHYDSHHQGYSEFTLEKMASPAYPQVPNYGKAVDAFDIDGTLFNQEKLNLQVKKTSSMLAGTDALREQIASLKYRVQKTKQQIQENSQDLFSNAMGIGDSESMIAYSRERLHTLDGRIHDVDRGFRDFQGRLVIDREVIQMMCHQYAYAEQVPAQCDFSLGLLTKPNEYRWTWPDDSEKEPILPPKQHKERHYEFVSASKNGNPQVITLTLD